MDLQAVARPAAPPEMPAPLETYADTYSELTRAMEQLYLAVAKVNLNQDQVCILYSRDRPDNVGRFFRWSDYLAWYVHFFLPEIRDEAISSFSVQRLLEHYQLGKGSFSMDFPYQKDSAVDWLTILAFLRPGLDGQPCAYILVRRAGENHLLKSIINQYVYSNCDYFIYLDAKNNSYSMFSASDSGTPLPPTQCEDYSAELVKYARDFVVPEDQELVIREMQLSRIMDVLSRREVHSFSCGVVDPVLGYTRKRLDYRYHDRERQMILLSRTDITDIYLEEQEHQRALHEALTRAQTDPLTGLLNYQGTVDKITDSLACKEGRFALMFIDLDNFKGINDSLGHAAGDELLRQIAHALRASVRDSDLVGRVGGDEFVILMRWIHSLDEVRECAGRLCESIRAIPTDARQCLPTSCSIGIALAPEDGRDYETLVKKADRLVYQAKLEGKNQFSI